MNECILEYSVCFTIIIIECLLYLLIFKTVLLFSLYKNLDQMRRQMNAQIKDEIEHIKQLKHDYNEEKKQVHKTEKILNAITDKNKELVASLEKAERDISHFEKDEAEMKVQDTMIRKQKKELDEAEEKLKSIEWKYEVLLQQYQVAVRERDENIQKIERAKREERQQRSSERGDCCIIDDDSAGNNQ